MNEIHLFEQRKDDIRDLRHLAWDVAKISPGTPGMFLKSYEEINDTLYYFKMSNFDSSRGVFGHEAINEIAAMNVAKILGISCLDYELIHCIIKIADGEYTTWVTKSKNFKQPNEDKVTLETFYELEHKDGESVMDFLLLKHLDDFLSEMFLLDWIICNRDRHGANVEVLLLEDTFRMAPLFDHGLSFMFSCYNSGELMQSFNYLQDLPVNNYLGSRILSENLTLVNDHVRERFFNTNFEESSILNCIPDDETAIPAVYKDCILRMIKERVNYAKNFFNS